MKRLSIFAYLLLVSLFVTLGARAGIPPMTGGAGTSSGLALDTMWAAEGDIAIATGNDAAIVLTKGAEGTILRAGAARPAYTTATYPATSVVNQLLYSSATNVIGGLAVGVEGSYLRTGASPFAPVWSTLLLPNAGSAFYLPVFTAANTMGQLAAAGATGQYLRGATGAIPAWSTLTLPDTATAFKLPVYSATNVMTELAAVGATGEVLMGATGAIPAWTSSPTITGTTFRVDSATDAMIGVDRGAQATDVGAIIFEDAGADIWYVGQQNGTNAFSIRQNIDLASGNGVEIVQDDAAHEFTDDDASQSVLSIRPEIAQTGTAGYIGIELDVTETTIGSGTNRLLDLQVGNASKFYVDRLGAATGAGFSTTRVASDAVSLTNAQYSQQYEDIDDGDHYRIYRQGNLTSTHVQLEPVGDPTAGQVKAYGVPAGGPPAISTGTWVTPLTTSTTSLALTGNITGLMPSVVVLVPSGVHDGGNDQAIMTDGGIDIGANTLVGMTVYNVTDGSSCTITANAATTITCTLAGGTQNDWDDNDVWQVGPGPSQSGSVFYVAGAGTSRHPATVGYAACYTADGTNKLTIDMASDAMIFTGTLDAAVVTLDAGDCIDSSDTTTDDFICLHNKSATVVKGFGKRGTWADGGAS